MIAELLWTLTPFAIAAGVWVVDRHHDRRAPLDDRRYGGGW